MARLWYRPTPADFVIGLGAQAEMLDAAEAPLVPQRFGRAALVPLTSDAFDVYLDAALTTVTTDLLDEAGTPITQWTSSDDFDTLGRGPAIQGPDGHEGPLYLSADGLTGYRIEPDSDALYGRVGDLETSVSGLTTGDLADVSETVPTDGQVLRFDNSLGVYVPATSEGTGTVTSVAGVAPVAGDVPTVDLKSALAAADAPTLAALTALLQSRTYVLCKPLDGGGYEAKPAGWILAIRPGAEQPVSQLAEWDIWLQPEST